MEAQAHDDVASPGLSGQFNYEAEMQGTNSLPVSSRSQAKGPSSLIKHPFFEDERYKAVGSQSRGL